MKQYEKRILNSLLDSYEKSSLSRGENKVQVHISYPFRKKNMPEYFDESSTAYEEIHAVTRQLERQGYLRIVWKNGKENHIIEKVILREEALPEIYRELKRIPKDSREKEALCCLERLQKTIDAPAACDFLMRMYDRIKEGKSVKEYMDMNHPEEMEKLICAAAWVEKNQKESFIREFSIRHFHDSKAFEGMVTKVCRILREYYPEYETLENEEILAEHQIYHTPGYVYLKGNVKISIQDQLIDVGSFSEGFGFSPGNDIRDSFAIVTGPEQIEYIFTVENLTTFFRFQKEKSLIIYLGGYHNGVRRNLLKDIYRQLPHAGYRHFGDIDAGGYQIFFHLMEKTGIPFERYRMDIDTLKTYEKYGKKLTENDRKRLMQLSEKYEDADMRETIGYMLGRNVKLEQECVVDG
ncbi:MAG: hypothetical protein HDR27_01575 [Lachnospiraceae bacterium]|nr:hypothetical protein [Lachnospiraceae bacterium]